MLTLFFHWKKTLNEKSLTSSTDEVQLLEAMAHTTVFKERNEEKWPNWG